MYQTFTGSSRKPRQVNLGGGKSNPFAKQSALQNAQLERENRERQRERLKTAHLLQRRWRGYTARKSTRRRWRAEWDAENNKDFKSYEEESDTFPGYEDQETALLQAQRLLQFVPKVGGYVDDVDEGRVRRTIAKIRSTQESEDVICAGGPWPMTYLRLQKLVLTQIRTTNGSSWSQQRMLDLDFADAEFLGNQVPELVWHNAGLINSTVVSVLENHNGRLKKQPEILHVMTRVLTQLLATGKEHEEEVYSSFASEFLVSRDVANGPFFPAYLDRLADCIRPTALAAAVSDIMHAKDYHGYALMQSPSKRFNLLGTFIYLHRQAHRHDKVQAYTSHKDFVHSISSLLLSLAADLPSFDLSGSYAGAQDDGSPLSNHFAREQVVSLVNQESIQSLLYGATNATLGTSGPKMNSEAKQLANYALTLLRFFPRKADEIRMWLYMGSTAGNASVNRIPAIKYFWQAARSSMVFSRISKDAPSVIRLLKPQPVWYGEDENGQHTEWVQDDWRVILIFLELYTFVLKLMDDEEFFSASASSFSANNDNAKTSSWARTNALPLEDVKDLTLFLKNLGFIMYFNAKDITEETEGSAADTGSLSSYFKVASPERDELSDFPKLLKTPETALAGLAGISIDYVKGLVTGLLRMVHERDSRRKFLPKDHWLMTSLFEMDSFIPDVVAEEENRHQVEQDDDDADLLDDEMEEYSSNYVGTSRERHLRDLQNLKRKQKMMSRKRYLQAVAPRSEILQNMPFFIPFTTRVEIFREFVKRDQFRRREGLIDGELWRLSQASSFHAPNNLAKHTATIRREHEFDDAYEQFYSLKEGLKEPIQITFLDRFGQQEAGIDGGGVTKEFLTSVTNQAFSPADEGIDLFKENEQRLLFPNPTAMEEQKAKMAEFSIRERTPDYNTMMQALLRKYEFLGRIIGKCLYEGILVDINFAGFFLLKWALTGGDGVATRESGYRANLNDLRDIDESLYKGLIQLKNYTGNVADDLALDFTITDTFVTDKETGEEKSVTKDLKPDGGNITVTNENRLVYISYVARHRLVTQPYAQTNAFLRGLSSMISPSWLSMFNQSELQTLIGGTSSSIDISDLRRNTAYGGVYVIGDDGLEHPTVALFWSVMESLKDEDRRKVLKFVTSTPRAPLLGFGSLNPRFSIRDSSEDETRLPSTSTCVNLLKLPRYRSREVLREKLLYAVNSGAGFDLS